MIAISVTGYAITVGIAASLGTALARPRSARLLIPYLSTSILAVAFGAMRHGDRAAIAPDGSLGFGAATLGYMLAIKVNAQVTGLPLLISLDRSRSWFVGVAIIETVLALHIARGIDRLA